MTYRFFAVALAVLSLSCGVADEATEGVDPTDQSEQAVKAKCAAVRCAAGTVCKVVRGNAACVPDSARVTCGPNTCAAGDVCCNASCGICTPPGGFCTQQFCL